jgi:hypothetical protein
MKIRFLLTNALFLLFTLLSVSLQAQNVQIKLVPIDSLSRDSLKNISERLYDYVVKNKISAYDAKLDFPVNNDDAKMKLTMMKDILAVSDDPSDPYSTKDTILTSSFHSEGINGFLVWYDSGKKDVIIAISPYYSLEGFEVPQSTFWVQWDDCEKYAPQFAYLKAYILKHL